MSVTDPRPLRILFVEDDVYLRDTMAVLLEEPGRDIVFSASAEEALRLWRASPFDALVTDVSLGAMSGTDLARAVLADAPTAWVVLSSGYVLDLALDALGPNVRLLPKPFELQAMDRLLEEARASRDA